MASAECAADPWLAELMGRPVFRVSPPAAGSSLPAGGEPWRTPGAFAYAKADCGDAAAVRWLEDRGFRLADINITLEKRDFRDAFADEAGAVFREARPGDREQVAALAGSSFRFSRFHRDPGIDRGTADRIKAEWAGNYFSGKRGDLMVVAEEGGRIGAFIQALGAKAGDPIIDLIAVDGSVRRKGLARGLSLYLESLCGGMKRIRVGTQLANGPAMALYQSLGYRVVAAQLVYHRHGGGRVAHLDIGNEGGTHG